MANTANRVRAADRDVTHDVLRDALAMRLGGLTEVGVGHADERLDVVVYGQGDDPDLLIEVKPIQLLRQAIGQLNSYAVRWPRPHLKRVHLFIPESTISPRAQRRRIREHQRSGELDGIELTVEQGHPELLIGDCYEIAGIRFGLTAPQQDITAHVASIRSDFLLAGYLAPPHRQFLLELAQAWRHPGAATGVEAMQGSTPTGQPAMVVLVHGATPNAIPMPVDEAIRSWLRIQRYRWLAAPTLPS